MTNKGQIGHTLVITNYKPGEAVLYEIVLLKGSLTNNNCSTRESSILIEQNEFLLSQKNTFKALVRLKKGQNSICIEYCCQSFNFELVCDTPNNRQRYVTPLYVIFKGHDGSFQNLKDYPKDSSSALSRINLNCQLIQTILAEKLYETHQKHITFHLTEPKVFQSSITIEEYHKLESTKLFDLLAHDIARSEYGNSNIKHVAFLAGTEYQGSLYKDQMMYDDLVVLTKRYIALGCGGLAVFHTACLYSWPEVLDNVIKAFMDETKINRRELLDDSNYRGTYGACYSTTLGAVLHELCHTFNLGHADIGIMSRGFDDVRDIFLVDGVDVIEADQRKGAHGITDSTSLHKSGAQILRYNKWFLSDERDLPFTITFDKQHNIIRSSWGIRVVEIRSGDAEIMTQNWIYPVAKMNIQLQLSDLAQNSKLFIQDTKGNFITQNIN